ncbi:Uncharacterised protein [Cedecea neteri]|nr:Uncharacterised protein [Cedecea neteri]
MEVQVVAHRSGRLKRGVEKGASLAAGQPLGEIG